MNDEHTTDDDLRGWGHGLAAWILATYTADGDAVLDLDADPAIRIAAETRHRTYLTGITPATTTPDGPLAGVRLALARWPQPTLYSTTASSGQSPERTLLTGLAGLLAPDSWVALVASLPMPSQPLIIHTGPLLGAAHGAGLGHLHAVHVTAADPTTTGGPVYRYALIFRRTGHPANLSGEPSGAWSTEPTDG